MYTCDICGRQCKKKIRLKGYTLCSKHMHQLLNYGKFLDNNPRTTNDPNDYEVCGRITKVNLYNVNNECIGQFIIDTTDLNLIKGRKWRKSHTHVVSGQPSKKEGRELTHILLGIDPKDDSTTIIDHIDGNGMNNRRSNLRICTQAENLRNQRFMSNNTSGFIGVSYDKNRNRYNAEIRMNDKRLHIGRYKTLEEAVYARMIAEKNAFGCFINSEQYKEKYILTKSLPKSRKSEIESYVIKKMLKNNFGD